MKVLWISPYAPYDSVGHGGGQNHNYYLKYIKKNTNFDITLLSVCDKNERFKINLEQYGIKNIIKEFDNHNIKQIFQYALGKICLERDGGLLNNAKYHLLLKAIEEYYKMNKSAPQVIILQWTEAVNLVKKLKKKYPNSIYIAIEEDVAFLGYFRKYEEAKGLMRFYKKIKYIFLKRAELNALRDCNYVIALNDKDKSLLIKSGIYDKKIVRMCSYHGFYENAIYEPNQYRLLFYGAMARKENYLSVIWFIENVMPRLDEKYKLYIVGSNPTQDILNYQSERIIVTGYVESIKPYFEQSLCLVAPLVLGAGIKIKILEALSAGLPVLTNEIGAEGIGLSDGINYLHCKEAVDYCKAIEKLSTDSKLRKEISIAGKKHISQNFNVDESLNKLIDIIALYDK